MKKKQLIIYGIGTYAQVAYEYFSHDSEYEVAAFICKKEYMSSQQLLGVDIYAFEDVQEKFSAQDYYFFVALGFANLNKDREEIYKKFKGYGYVAASYISSKAFVWRNAKIGEHCFIIENAVIQPFVEIGDNVVIWNNANISHHSKVGDNSFIAAGGLLAGNCKMGKNCFLGINSSVSDSVKIGDYCWLSYATILNSDIKDYSLVKNTESKKIELNEKLIQRTISMSMAILADRRKKS